MDSNRWPKKDNQNNNYYKPSSNQFNRDNHYRNGDRRYDNRYNNRYTAAFSNFNSFSNNRNESSKQLVPSRLLKDKEPMISSTPPPIKVDFNDLKEQSPKMPEVIKCDGILEQCGLVDRTIPKTVKVYSSVSRKRHSEPIEEINVKKQKIDKSDKKAEEKPTLKHLEQVEMEYRVKKTALKGQRADIKRLQEELETAKNNMKVLKASKKATWQQRVKLFAELQNAKEDSSDEYDSEDDDDDVQIIEVTHKKPTQSVEESSSADDGDVEIVINPKPESTSNQAADAAAAASMYSSKSTSQGLADSFSLLHPASTTAVEPSVEPITVSKQPDTFITDIKVFQDSLFISASHGILRRYDLSTHECLAHYVGHCALIHCIFPTAQPIGVKRLFSGGFDNKMLVHDIETLAMTDSVPTLSPVMSICEANNRIYFGTSGGIIHVHTLDDSKSTKEFRVLQGGLACVAAAKEGSKSLIFVGATNGELSVWDAEKTTKLKNISVPDHKGIPIGFMAMVKQRLLVFSKSNIHFIYYSSEKTPITINHFRKNNSLCLTKNYVIIGSTEGAILVNKLKGSTILKTSLVTYCNTNSPILAITFYNNTIISGDKKGNLYFNRLIEK